MEQKIQSRFASVFGASSPVNLTHLSIPKSMLAAPRVTKTVKKVSTESLVSPEINSLSPVQKITTPPSVTDEIQPIPVSPVPKVTTPPSVIDEIQSIPLPPVPKVSMPTSMYKKIQFIPETSAPKSTMPTPVIDEIKSIPQTSVPKISMPIPVIDEDPVQAPAVGTQNGKNAACKEKCQITKLFGFECPAHDFVIPKLLSPIRDLDESIPEVEPTQEINNNAVEELQAEFVGLFGCHSPIRLQDYGVPEPKPSTTLATCSPGEGTSSTSEEPSKEKPKAASCRTDKSSFVDLFGPLTPEYSPDHLETSVPDLSTTGKTHSVPDPPSDQPSKTKHRKVKKAKHRHRERRRERHREKSKRKAAKMEKIDDGLPAKPPTPRCYLDECDEQNENWKNWFEIPFADPSKEAAARLIDRRYSELFP